MHLVIGCNQVIVGRSAYRRGCRRSPNVAGKIGEVSMQFLNVGDMFVDRTVKLKVSVYTYLD